MSEAEIGRIILTLGLLLGATQFMGYLFERLRQPRLVGEIVTGILLGPFVLGLLAPSLSARLFGVNGSEGPIATVLSFFYWFGLMLLMFISGSQARGLLGSENRRETAWLLGVGTPLPFFIVLILGSNNVIPIEPLVGQAGQRTAALLVLAIAAAVTSIPVISRIFYDLKILHTRFASLILGSAVLEDIVLWAVLALAAALAATGDLTETGVIGEMTSHTAATMLYMGLGLFVAPSLLTRFHKTRYNILRKSSALAYVIVVLFLYVGVAAVLGVNLVFAAFLAGFGIVGGINGTQRERFASALGSIEAVAASIFIPIYFTLVGYRLVFGTQFSLPMLLIFLVGSSVLAIIAVGIAARLAGFTGLDVVNIAITNNARGGPGIVLATVAYDAGIINAAFYTTLVLAAVLTSQAAQVWLAFVLKKGWPLLSGPEPGLSASGAPGEAGVPAQAATSDRSLHP